jgi:aryl-alcohol dehydrogenase
MSVSVTAAVTEAPGAEFALREVELGELRPDEVLVEIAASGICHTDLLIREGTFPTPMPVVLGHEGAGVVERVGSAVSTVGPGDRVALSYGSCGTCPTCLTGHPYCCHDFFGRNFGASRPDGTTALSLAGRPVHTHFFGQSSFATHAVAPERSVAKIPDGIPFEVVAPFGCGIQTGAGTVLNALRPPVGSAIAVFGTGGVGMAAIMAAVIVGCETIVGVDLKPERLELARELGATHVVDAREEDPVEAIGRLTGPGADFTVEASGSVQALRQAVDATAPMGVCALVGAPPLGAEVSLDVNAVLSRGRTIRAVVEGESIPSLFIPQLAALWQAGRFPVDRLVRRFDFDEINEAAESAERGDAVKPVLVMKS